MKPTEQLTDEQITRNRAFVEALRTDPRVREAIQEGRNDIAAKRSTVYATKEEFIRDFVSK